MSSMILYHGSDSEKIPSRTLYRAYSPLHEVSYDKACEKLYAKFLQTKEREM